MVELLRGRAGPVVRVGRDEEPHAHPAPGRPLDPADHAAIGDVGVDDVEGLARAVEHPRDLVGDRAVLARRVVQDDRRDLARAGFGEQAVELLGRNLAAEPAEARDEDELELRDDGPGHTEEEVMEAAVLEVVLDPGAADPADTPVHEHDLAVVDVAQAGEVPVQARRRPRVRREPPAAWSRGRRRLRRPPRSAARSARGLPPPAQSPAGRPRGAPVRPPSPCGSTRRRSGRRPRQGGSRTG